MLKLVYLKSIIVSSLAAFGGLFYLYVLGINNLPQADFYYYSSARLLAGPILILATLGRIYAMSRYSRKQVFLGFATKLASAILVIKRVAFINISFFLIFYILGIDLLLPAICLIPLNIQTSFLVMRVFKGENYASIYQIIMQFVSPIIVFFLNNDFTFFTCFSYLFSLIFFAYSILVNLNFFQMSNKRKIYPAIKQFCINKSVHGVLRRSSPIIFMITVGSIFKENILIVSVIAYSIRVLDLFSGAFFRISQVYISEISKDRHEKNTISFLIILVTLFLSILVYIFNDNVSLVLSLLLMSYFVSVVSQIYFESRDNILKTSFSPFLFYYCLFTLVIA